MHPRLLSAGRFAVAFAVPLLVLAGLWQVDAFRELLARGAPLILAQGASAGPVDVAPSFEGPDKRRKRHDVSLVDIGLAVAQPTDLQFPPGRSDVLVALSKGGEALVYELGTRKQRTWFEVEVLTRSEMGLLGLAFAPDFAESGLFYTNRVTAGPGAGVTRVERWKCPDPAGLVGAERLGEVLAVEQPYANHDAGVLLFGPDGMLYVPLGDGGSGGDPLGHGQNTGTLLGAVLRLDVGTEPYAVPADNPLVGKPGARPEIWAWGVRNPWRASFDPRGRLVVADVGQDRVEEVALVASGENHGWRIREGDTCFEPRVGCRTAGLVDPVWTYGRDVGASITGGHVWTAEGPLKGRYLLGDFVSGRLFALDLDARDALFLGKWPVNPSTFGRSSDGVVYVADFGKGRVYRIE